MWNNKPERKSFIFIKLKFSIHTKDCKVYRIYLCEWDQYQIIQTPARLFASATTNQFGMRIRLCLNPIIVMALEILYLIFTNNNIIIPNCGHMISKRKINPLYGE
jgi:hypothetical protein